MKLTKLGELYRSNIFCIFLSMKIAEFICTFFLKLVTQPLMLSFFFLFFLQAKGYTIRFFGAIMGAILGAVLYNQDEWGWGVPIYGIFLINGLTPILVISPFLYNLVESKAEEPPVISQQLASIWSA